jgi:uncharacterized membrane protein HdeD (DUF308 family)
MMATTKTWGVLAARGVAALLFGTPALVWPGVTLGFMVALFGAYALIDGTTSVIAAIAGKGVPRRRRGWVATEGVLGIFAGLGTLLWPGVTAVALLVTIAVWAIAVGIMRIVAAGRGDGVVWSTGLSGLCGVSGIRASSARDVMPSFANTLRR